MSKLELEKELAHLDYEDMLVQLNSTFEQYGCRNVLKDFRTSFPAMFEELQVQINRLGPVPKSVLLR